MMLGSLRYAPVFHCVRLRYPLRRIQAESKCVITRSNDFEAPYECAHVCMYDQAKSDVEHEIGAFLHALRHS